MNENPETWAFDDYDDSKTHQDKRQETPRDVFKVKKKQREKENSIERDGSPKANDRHNSGH